MSTPATVEIWESNGAGEVPTKITGLDFGSDDAPNLVAANHPLVIPVVGQRFSYQKFTRWKVIAWVDTNTIDNLKWFKSAGVAATGWTEGRTADNQTYFTPDRLGTGFVNTWPTTAGTARSLTGSISKPTIGYITATYVCLMVFIDNTVVAGPKGSHTITYRYDES